MQHAPLALIALILPLTACQTTGAQAPATHPLAQSGPCNADALPPFIGQIASAETAAALLKSSAAKNPPLGRAGHRAHHGLPPRPVDRQL